MFDQLNSVSRSGAAWAMLIAAVCVGGAAGCSDDDAPSEPPAASTGGTPGGAAAGGDSSGGGSVGGGSGASTPTGGTGASDGGAGGSAGAPMGPIEPRCRPLCELATAFPECSRVDCRTSCAALYDEFPGCESELFAYASCVAAVPVDQLECDEVVVPVDTSQCSVESQAALDCFNNLPPPEGSNE